MYARSFALAAATQLFFFPCGQEGGSTYLGIVVINSFRVRDVCFHGKSHLLSWNGDQICINPFPFFFSSMGRVTSL